MVALLTLIAVGFASLAAKPTLAIMLMETIKIILPNWTEIANLLQKTPEILADVTWWKLEPAMIPPQRLFSLKNWGVSLGVYRVWGELGCIALLALQTIEMSCARMMKEYARYRHQHPLIKSWRRLLRQYLLDLISKQKYSNMFS